MLRVAKMAPKRLLLSLMKNEDYSLKAAHMWLIHGNEGEKEIRTRWDEGIGSDQVGADRHVSSTAQCLCNRQMDYAGSCTHRQTAL